MKKLFLFLVLCLSSSLVVNAQTKRPAKKSTKTSVVQKTQTVSKVENPTFEKTTFSFLPSAEFTTGTDKEYVVFEVPGWTQSELYNKMLIGISKLFKNPNKVITKLENELITINGMTDYCVQYGKYHYGFTYTITFEFKDGKIRCNTPSVNGFVPVGDTPQSNVIGWIRTQGNYEEVKPGFESGINDEIYTFLTKSFDKEDSDW